MAMSLAELELQIVTSTKSIQPNRPPTGESSKKSPTTNAIPDGTLDDFNKFISQSISQILDLMYV
jgi:hypothetical protein